ncbi:hypothetical protein XthCFBP4691_04600 [Xanthomonas theicola]|uniref:Chloride channel protein n=1 Tax=Xanthomonas theicola TaxID=56464 RepID=A0A2S6ZJ09_9XANT|nr:hypothetical protein XthCFBP4691_04600 [Xanthomonas theicola]
MDGHWEATRRQILRRFQAKGFILATFGIVIGMIGAYGIDQMLMNYYELGRLPFCIFPSARPLCE